MRILKGISIRNAICEIVNNAIDYNNYIVIINFYRNTHTGTLKSILTNLRGRLSESISHIPIRREYVLMDALRTVKRASFCYSNKIMVHNNDKCILLSIIILQRWSF